MIYPLWIELSNVTTGGYLFPSGDHTAPYSEPMWSNIIKSIFERHGGVALAPKDLRSSFVGFLKSGAHDDTVLKAAAAAMKHSSKTQASIAYDKRQYERNTAAAIEVAVNYAAQFPARATTVPH